MKKALFVAGLDYSISDDQLKEVFSSWGTVVSARVIMDRETGKSRGFAFVEMATSKEAQDCIDNLHNTSINGRQIAVKIKEERPANNRY